MDYELARFIAARAFRSSTNLTELVPFLKEFLEDEEEYKVYARAIAHVSAQIQLTLLKELYARHPEIEREFEKNIKKYQNILY